MSKAKKPGHWSDYIQPRGGILSSIFGSPNRLSSKVFPVAVHAMDHDSVTHKTIKLTALRRHDDTWDILERNKSHMLFPNADPNPGFGRSPDLKILDTQYTIICSGLTRSDVMGVIDHFNQTNAKSLIIPAPRNTSPSPA